VGHNAIQVKKYMEEGAEDLLKEKEREINARKEIEKNLALKDKEFQFTSELSKKDQVISELTNEVSKLKNFYTKNIEELTYKKDSDKELQLEKLKNALESEQKQKEDLLREEINTLKISNSNELNKLQNIIKEKDGQLENIKQNKEIQIVASKNELENAYKDQLNNLQNKVNALNIQLEQIKKETENSIKEVTLKKETENSINIQKINSNYEIKISAIKAEAQKEISQLKIKNAENRILQSKTKGEN